MDIYNMPIRCVRTSEEIRQIEKNLNTQANEIQAVISSLKRSDDESMMMVANKLQKTEEHLRVKIRLTNKIGLALSKIAAVYSKNEDGIMAYEEWDISRRGNRFKTYTISRNRDRVNRTFEKL